MTAYIAPRSITQKTAAIHPASSILSPPQKASPPATQSCLLPPPWPSRSQDAEAWPCPPLWPSCSSPDGTTLAATTVVTFTPPGLTAGKANSCSDNSSNLHSPGLDSWQSNKSGGWSLDSYMDGPSDNLSHPHSPGLNPWQSDRSVGEGKGSSSDVYNCMTDDGQVPQGSNGSSSCSKG
jgi:hypothetical protein